MVTPRDPLQLGSAPSAPSLAATLAATLADLADLGAAFLGSSPGGFGGWRVTFKASSLKSERSFMASSWCGPLPMWRFGVHIKTIRLHMSEPLNT